MSSPTFADDAAATRQLLGPVRQVGYVVPDLDAAIDSWTRRQGVGPWRVRKLRLNRCIYKGEAIDVELAIASSYSDGLEIELIAQEGGPASMYSDHLQSSGPGAQHLCFYPSDYQLAKSHLLANGMEVILEGTIGTIDFAYLGDGQGQVIEIADLPPEGLASRLERAEVARSWRGPEPS